MTPWGAKNLKFEEKHTLKRGLTLLDFSRTNLSKLSQKEMFCTKCNVVNLYLNMLSAKYEIETFYTLPSRFRQSME